MVSESSPCSSQPLLVESVSEVSEDPLELGMLTGNPAQGIDGGGRGVAENRQSLTAPSSSVSEGGNCGGGVARTSPPVCSRLHLPGPLSVHPAGGDAGRRRLHEPLFESMCTEEVMTYAQGNMQDIDKLLSSLLQLVYACLHIRHVCSLENSVCYWAWISSW